MDISLREITNENLDQVIALKVRTDQTHVASNFDSLKQAEEDPDDICLAIYSNDEPVGFVMYANDYDDNCLWISRFMIDSQHQGKGYGSAALSLLKQIALEDPNITKLGLSTHLGNVEGISFYTKFGFVDTHADDGEADPEEIFELVLSK